MATLEMRVGPREQGIEDVGANQLPRGGAVSSFIERIIAVAEAEKALKAI